MADARPELMEAMDEAGRAYGVQLAVADQVAVARVLDSSAEMTAEDVLTAFAKRKLRRPPPGYARAVVSRARSLGGAPTLLDVLLDYRQHAISHLSRRYGGKTKGKEDVLHENLMTYLPQHGLRGARAGRGETDIFIPSPKSIIEVKAWSSMTEYKDGLKELAAYIRTERPLHAAVVVFCDSEPLPPIIASHDQAIADTPVLEGIRVPVVVVPLETVAPSRLGRAERARERK